MDLSDADVACLIGKEAYPVQKRGCLKFEFRENVIVSRHFTAADELLNVLNDKFRLFQRN